MRFVPTLVELNLPWSQMIIKLLLDLWISYCEIFYSISNSSYICTSAISKGQQEHSGINHYEEHVSEIIY